MTIHEIAEELRTLPHPNAFRTVKYFEAGTFPAGGDYTYARPVESVRKAFPALEHLTYRWAELGESGDVLATNLLRKGES